MLCCERFGPVQREEIPRISLQPQQLQLAGTTLTPPVSPSCSKKRRVSVVSTSSAASRTKSVRFEEPEAAQEGSVCKKRKILQRRSSSLEVQLKVPELKREASSSVSSASVSSASDSPSTWTCKTDFLATVKATEDLAIDFLAKSQSVTTPEHELSNIIATTYASCCLEHNFSEQITSSLTHHLTNAVASQPQHYRGIERAGVLAYGQEALKRRKEIITTVLSLQSSLKASSSPLDEKQELLSTICEKQTRPSRRFAQCMANVDQMLAMVEYHTTT